MKPHHPFEAITRCIHVAHVIGDESGKASLDYDKLHKVRWLIEEVKERCKAN